MQARGLRGPTLANRLSAGRRATEARGIPRGHILAPMSDVATQTGHIAPRRSARTAAPFTDGGLHAVLAGGGHHTPSRRSRAIPAGPAGPATGP